MARSQSAKIPFPLSSFPGKNPQESSGRLINVTAESLGETGSDKFVWRRSAGLSQHAATANSGHRGGMVVNNLSFETWANNASTVDASGNVVSIGNLPGTKKVSIARNQSSATPDVIAVDIDNGAYVLSSATVAAATATVTIGGTNFNRGDLVNLIFLNPYVDSFPVTVTYTLGNSETAATVAAGLNAVINANAALVAANVTSTVAGAVITVNHLGSIGNITTLSYGIGGAEYPVTTDLGAVASTVGATVALTGVTVPAGAIVVVAITELSSAVGSVSDGVNGSYGIALSQSYNTSADSTALYYFANSAALSAQTITYTKATSGSKVILSAFYITGTATTSVLDPTISAAASGSSTNPVVKSGTPSQDNDLIVGVMACTGQPSYFQASGFSAPPTAGAIAATALLAGGTILPTSRTAQTFAPVLGTSEPWAAMIIGFKAGTGTETVTFSPTTGVLSGGSGTPGAFTGIPTLYNGQGKLPQPNSVCSQDGYLFFTIASGQVYATGINSLLMNALTYITAQAKADVTLLRGVAFSGHLMLFTTGSCEVWQDAAKTAPVFPYSRIAVLEFGLVQASAIAGFETGFSELLWVAQDFSVHWMTAGDLSQIKVSPPDLSRFIETEIKAGNVLEASCYIADGKKFWCLSSLNWTWEFNLQTKKWSERQSLTTTGVFGRWRATSGHPAFGKWLVGDQVSGNILFIDPDNKTENGAVQRRRIESGPVKDFPNKIRVARADFDFVLGVGVAVGNFKMKVTGAASGTGGIVRLTVDKTSQASTNDVCAISGVTGTTEANGTFSITVIDATHIELQGINFVHAYVSGGTAIDLTSPPNAIDPTVAISMSKDGGLNWGNPLIRQLGMQGNSLRSFISVKNMGLSGRMGNRWRIDCSDPVEFAFMGGTQSSDPRMPET